MTRKKTRATFLDKLIYLQINLVTSIIVNSIKFAKFSKVLLVGSFPVVAELKTRLCHRLFLSVNGWTKSNLVGQIYYTFIMGDH